MIKETIIQFVAYDGTCFKTEKECMDYENNLTEPCAQLSKIKVFDKNGDPIQMPQYGSKNFKNDFDAIFCGADSAFCILSEDLTSSTKLYVNKVFGENFIPYKKGVYRYSYDEYEWISYEEDYNNFMKKWPHLKTE